MLVLDFIVLYLLCEGVAILVFLIYQSLNQAIDQKWRNHQLYDWLKRNLATFCSFGLSWGQGRRNLNCT